MDDSGDLLNDISALLRNTESLLMDFDMAPASQGVIDLDDSAVVTLTSTEDEPSPHGSTSRRQPRGSRGVRRRANPPQSNRAIVQAVVDLCSPMGPPLFSNTTNNNTTSSRRTSRRGGTRQRRTNQNYSSDDAETINLDDSVSDYYTVPPVPSRSTNNPPPARTSSSLADQSTDGSGPHCPICLSSWTSPVSTMCGHIFCKDCLAQWIKVDKKCPVCKSGGAKLKTHPIFIS